MCQKSDILLVSEFSTLVRCIIFAIFVYLHIIFIKCLISQPNVVSTDGLPSRMVHHHIHTAKNTINYLKTENVSFIEPQIWSPNSPDLNPVDYAVWGETVNKIPPPQIVLGAFVANRR